VLLPRQQAMLARGAKDKEHAMSQTPNTAIAVIGIDIGKNSSRRKSGALSSSIPRAGSLLTTL
jgi:hypothetical protein